MGYNYLNNGRNAICKYICMVKSCCIVSSSMLGNSARIKLKYYSLVRNYTIWQTNSDPVQFLI